MNDKDVDTASKEILETILCMPKTLGDSYIAALTSINPSLKDSKIEELLASLMKEFGLLTTRFKHKLVPRDSAASYVELNRLTPGQINLIRTLNDYVKSNGIQFGKISLGNADGIPVLGYSGNDSNDIAVVGKINDHLKTYHASKSELEAQVTGLQETVGTVSAEKSTALEEKTKAEGRLSEVEGEKRGLEERLAGIIQAIPADAAGSTYRINGVLYVPATILSQSAEPNTGTELVPSQILRDVKANIGQRVTDIYTAELELRVRKLVGDVETLNTDLTRTREEYRELEVQYSVSEGQNGLLRSENGNLTERLSTAGGTIEELHSTVQGLNSNLGGLRVIVSGLEDELNTVKNNYAKTESELYKSRRENSRLSSQSKNDQLQIEEGRRQLAAINERVNAVSRSYAQLQLTHAETEQLRMNQEREVGELTRIVDSKGQELYVVKGGQEDLLNRVEVAEGLVRSLQETNTQLQSKLTEYDSKLEQERMAHQQQLTAVENRYARIASNTVERARMIEGRVQGLLTDSSPK